MNNKHSVLSFPIYPILFGIYPVLYLWSANRTQEPAYVILPSLMVTVISLAVIYLLSILVLRNIHRAALVALLIGFYLVSYGQLTSPLRNNFEELPEQSFLFGSAAILVALVLAAVLFARPGQQFSKTLNLISAGLILFPLFTAAPYYMTVTAKANAATNVEGTVNAATLSKDSQPRDVYFIMIDNYGRQDALQSNSSFDNSELVRELEKRGFVLPDCAQGNYFHTAPMISSILNMDYLDKFGIEDTVYSKRSGYNSMLPLMQDSLVIRKFRTYGYHTVTYRGFMGLIDIKTSDTYINFEQDKAYTQRLETKNFNNLYYQTTVFHPINDIYKFYPDLLAQKGPEFLKQYLPKDLPIEERFYQVYLQNLYSFEMLERIPTEIKGPKFVYAHIYSAHWPFLMSPDGSLRLPFSEKMTVEGYIDGIKFTNNRLLTAIDTILENSETEPVIILQGDHNNGWEGKVEWSGKERLKILSAYYLPDGGDRLLYDTISPVNNFRLVFKHYFGEDIDLLPDVWRYLDRATKTVQLAPQTCISDSIK